MSIQNSFMLYLALFTMHALLKSIKGHSLVRVLFAIVFISSASFACILQFLIYVLIRPWNATVFRKLNYYLMYMVYNQIIFLVEWWSESEFDLFMNPDDLKYFGKEHAFIALNHGKEIDALLAWTIMEHFGVLGNARGITKSSLIYVPIYGLNLFFGENVFIHRDWEKDQKQFERKLQDLTEYPDPMWFTILPEGTRLTPEKVKMSKEIARKKGLPELNNVLLPRTKGFIATVKNLRGKVPAIYIMTIAVCKNSLENASLVGLLQGKKVYFRVMLKRYLLHELPQDEKELTNWLHKRYQEKDKLLENIYVSGEFEPDAKSASTEEMKKLHQKYKYVPIPPSRSSLLTAVLSAGVILGSLLTYVVAVFMRRDYFQFGAIIATTIAASAGLNKATSMVASISAYGGTKSSKT